MLGTPPTATFEEMLRELHETVARLEEQRLTLDEAVGAYERCVELANACAALLDQAELRVSTIDRESRAVREQAAVYRFDQEAARMLLGDDEEDLADLLDDE